MDIPTKEYIMTLTGQAVRLNDYVGPAIVGVGVPTDSPATTGDVVEYTSLGGGQTLTAVLGGRAGGRRFTANEGRVYLIDHAATRAAVA